MSFYGVIPTSEPLLSVAEVLPTPLNISLPKTSISEASFSAMESSSPGSPSSLLQPLLQASAHKHLLCAYHMPRAVSIK